RQVVFIKPEQLIAGVESVIKLQRDYGDRGDRKHARLKYVVAEKGLAWCKETMEGYFGSKLDDPHPVKKWEVIDHVGWYEQGDGKWFLGVPVPSGRIGDNLNGVNYRSALREVVSTYKMPLILTVDQNIILSDIEAGEKQAIAGILRKHGIR